MSQITQKYPIMAKTLYDAVKLQYDINQLFAIINKLDNTNLDCSGGEFSWANTKLVDIVDPLGEYDDIATDGQAAVTKNWIYEKLFGAGKVLDVTTGLWHSHLNKVALDGVVDQGDGYIPSAAERAKFLTDDQSAAVNGASAPSASNPFATLTNVVGREIISNVASPALALGASSVLMNITWSGIANMVMGTISMEGTSCNMLSMNFYYMKSTNTFIGLAIGIHLAAVAFWRGPLIRTVNPDSSSFQTVANGVVSGVIEFLVQVRMNGPQLEISFIPVGGGISAASWGVASVAAIF